MVSEALLTVMVGAVPPRVMEVPPERTMAPEPEAKVRVFPLTAPLIPMVPAARPVAPLPKFRASAVVVT